MRTIFRGRDGLYHCLYKTTNNVNGKYYIGIHSTDDIDDGYLGSGVVLKKAIKKYGKDNFSHEIIECFDSREELSKAEYNYVDMKVVADKKSYNQVLGGDSGSGYGFTRGMVTVKDKDGNTCLMSKTDPRYISGEYKFIRANLGAYMDKDGNVINTSSEDPRVISGELMGCTKGKVTARRVIDGKYVSISKDDPGLSNGQYVLDWINMDGRKYYRWVKKDGIVKSIHLSQLESYLNGGWVVGNIHKGLKCITKNGKNKRVYPEEVEEYVKNGWVLGTNQKYPTSSKSKGGRYVNKDGVCKLIRPEELQFYTSNGWKPGMK